MTLPAQRQWAPVPSALQAIVAEQQRRKRTFGEFVEQHNPTALLIEHAPRLVAVADKVARGEILRLIVLAPPRYIKSELFSRLFCPFYLRRHPRRRVGLVSYGSSLAWELSEAAQNFYVMDGGRLASSTTAKRLWNTAEGGGMWAVGTGGALLGRGFHLGVIDDPTDPEKAVSPVYQRRFQGWFPAKFLSRQDPNAAIIMVMQRLGTGDPVDFLLRREVGDGVEYAPQNWHVVVCDEIKSDEPLGRWDGPMGLPQTCTLEPDPRKVGELLAPTLFNAEQVEIRRRGAGPFVVSAQRQQRPMAPAGDFWKKTWFRTYDSLPSSAYDGGKDWDTAYTKDEANSASAFTHSYRGPGKDDEFPIYIDDINWDWLEFPQLIEWMKGLSGPHYVEEKASGKSVVQALKVHGITATPVEVKGDKFARAAAVQPVLANGRVFVRKAILETLLSGEEQGLLRVTVEGLQAAQGGLDLNDAFVQALQRQIGLGVKKTKLSLQWR